jgi:hypothetical protein
MWFAGLLSMSIESRHVPVVAEGQRVGTAVIAGEPSDEAAEVWQDFSTLALQQHRDLHPVHRVRSLVRPDRI